MTETPNLLADDDLIIGDYNAPHGNKFAAETAEQPIKNIIYYITFILILLALEGPNW